MSDGFIDGEIRLAESGSFSYLAFQPPLTGRQLEGMPKPYFRDGNDRVVSVEHIFMSIENFPNDTQDVGFDKDYFVEGGVEDLYDYAERVAEYLGDYSVRGLIMQVAPGSIFDQALEASA